MRTLRVLIVFVIAAAVALAGCGSSEVLPKVVGEAGSQPTLTWSGKDAPGELTVKVLSEGDGREVGEGDMVGVSYAGWKWGSKEPFDSSYTKGAPVAFSLDGVIEGWSQGLPGHHVGDRLEMAIPSDLAYGDTPQQPGAPAGPLLFVVEIGYAATADEVVASTADATPQDVTALTERGVTVNGDLGAEPSVTVDAGAAEPTETELFVVARGTGEEITADSSLLVHIAYSSWDGSAAESTWTQKQPQVVPMSSAANLTDLVGVPAGSRIVVLTAPGQNAQTGQATPAFAYVMDVETVL